MFSFKYLNFYLVLTFFSLFLMACGSGSSRPRGKQCSSDFNPLPLEMEAPGVQKISREEATKGLAVGTYRLEDMEYFLSDSSTQMKLHLKGSYDRTGQLFASTLCARNMKAGQPFELTETGIKEIKVNEKGDQLSLLSLNLQFDGWHLNNKIKDFPPLPEGSNEKENSLQKFYDDHDNGVQIYRQPDQNHYEVRSSKSISSTNHRMLMRFVFVPPSPSVP